MTFPTVRRITMYCQLEKVDCQKEETFDKWLHQRLRKQHMYKHKEVVHCHANPSLDVSMIEFTSETCSFISSERRILDGKYLRNLILDRKTV